MHIKNLSKDRKIWAGIAILITVSIAVLSLVRLKPASVSFTNVDKIGHAIAYFTLAFSWFQVSGVNKKRLLSVFICCFFYGIIIEVLQATITNYRSGEFYDILANSLGIVLALAVMVAFFSKKKTI